MTSLSELAPIAAILDRPHGLLEAPRFGPGGEVVYSDVLGGGLWACALDGVIEELLPKRRGIGGAVAHAKGGWVISGRSLLHLLPDGRQRELLVAGEGTWPGGEQACGFNDLGATADGELLAGVLRYRPLAGEPERPGQLLRLDASGEAHVLTEELTWPNGIGVAPDGATIYVSDYARACVLALDADGANLREFCRAPRGSADGLAVDSEGGVWVALGEGAGVARFAPDAALDQIAPVPVRFVSSLCFGGADMRDVLLTSGDNEIRPELGGAVFRGRSEHAGLALTPVIS